MPAALLKLLPIAVAAAASLGAQAGGDPRPDEPAQREERPANSGSRIERTEPGVIVIRGSNRPAAGGEDAGVPEPPKPESRTSAAKVYDPSGRPVPAPVTEKFERSEDGSVKLLRMLRNISGRETLYLSETERTVRETARGRTVERVVQRFDPDGRPAGQEVERIESRQRPDGSVETTTIVYTRTLSGRMEAVERRKSVEREEGSTRTVTTVTERPSVNGGFRPVTEEKSVEKRKGEHAAHIEIVRRAAVNGSGMQVVAREESNLSRQGPVSTTETNTWERSPATGSMTLSRRTVGELTERSDGSASEVVETFGASTAGGAANLNVTRPVLQEVVRREVTPAADGSIRQRTTVESRNPADPSRMGKAAVTETVVKPDDGGKAIRTEVFERSVNGRLRPSQVVIETVQDDGGR